ncbi:MAG: peptidyl-tRNA hydrolase [Nanoarchaeota archaeon]
MSKDKKAPKQVIIIRKDLNMRKGKMVAQGAHASMAIFFDMIIPEWGLYTVRNGDQYKYALWLPNYIKKLKKTIFPVLS